MSLAASQNTRRSEVAGCWVLCQCTERERVAKGRSGHGPWIRGEVLKGERTVRRSISCPLCAICSLVKRCVAFGIYRASSHLKLICLLAAGSCPGGVRPRGEPVTAHGRRSKSGRRRKGRRKEIVLELSVELPKARQPRSHGGRFNFASLFTL